MGTPNPRVGEGMQIVPGTVHQENLRGGIGCRDSTSTGEPCRDGLCLELRQSRVRTPWSGDARPDVTNSPPLPKDRQAIEEWMASRNRDLRDALEFGSADVISFVSNLLAQGVVKLAAQRASALALQSMEVQTSLGSRMVVTIDEADAKRRCVEGGGHC